MPQACLIALLAVMSTNTTLTSVNLDNCRLFSREVHNHADKSNGGGGLECLWCGMWRGRADDASVDVVVCALVGVQDIVPSHLSRMLLQNKKLRTLRYGKNGYASDP